MAKKDAVTIVGIAATVIIVAIIGYVIYEAIPGGGPENNTDAVINNVKGLPNNNPVSGLLSDDQLSGYVDTLYSNYNTNTTFGFGGGSLQGFLGLSNNTNAEVLAPLINVAYQMNNQAQWAQINQAYSGKTNGGNIISDVKSALSVSLASNSSDGNSTIAAINNYLNNLPQS